MQTRITRTMALSLLLGMIVLLALAVQSQAEPAPLAEPDLSTLPQAVASPARLAALRSESAVPCTPGDCSVYTQTLCNSVEKWANDTGPQWETYNCLDTQIFGSVPYSEAIFSLSIISDDLDFGLSIPLAREGMDNFGAVLDSCDSEDCLSATHIKSLTIYQHAIVPDAPQKTYTLTLDSPNMKGYGDAIISCGSHNTGWCAGVVSTTLTCGDYTVHDNTNNGPDNIIYYDTNYAYDGPELTYQFVLTEGRYVSPTLHYSGNASLDYNNYMSFFMLDNTCDQRSLLMYSGLAGETGSKAATYARWLPAGTYYLVVDGMHLPIGGDAFKLDMACTAVELSKEGKDLNGGPLYVGDTIEYSVSVRNTGGIALPGLKLVDNIPQNTTYVADSAKTMPAGTVTGPDPLLTATWSSLGAGQTATLTFHVTVDESALGKTVANTATASAQGFPTLREAGEVMGPVRPALQMRKQAAGGKQGKVMPGDAVTYTITVTNPDTVAVNGFTLTETLPAKVTYVAGSGVPAPTQVTAGTLVWTGQNIGPGGVLTYEFVVTVGDLSPGETLVNEVWLAQPGGEPISTTLSGPGRPFSRVYLPIVLKNH